MSWSRAQRSRVQPGVTPHVGVAGPPPTATAVEAGQWPTVCTCCGRRLEAPEAIPHRNLVRVVCTHCAWRHTPVSTSMLHHNTIPSWSSVEGCALWARHAVLRSSEHDRALGLLCYGAQPAMQFPLLWAVALRRQLRVTSKPGAATMSERVVATAFVAMCSEALWVQLSGAEPWLAVCDLPAGKLVHVTSAGSELDAVDTACVFKWLDGSSDPHLTFGPVLGSVGSNALPAKGASRYACFVRRRV